jgi:hypothetical protein
MALTKDRLRQGENPHIFISTTQKTTNSQAGSGIFTRVSANAPNPVKYTDPDGNASNQPLMLRQIETVIKIAMFYIENKDAIQKIGIGVLKVAGGIGLGGLGVGGGVGITTGISGGAATLGGVASAATAAGSVYAGAGVLDGIVMMSQGNDERMTNSKHNINSSSPEPSNVDDLYKNSIQDKSGVRWAKDENGIIHRFSKVSNGQTHWNGSTSGNHPIRMDDIPIDIRREFGVVR